MTLLPIRLGAMVLVWLHPVFFNPTLLHFALTNIKFCCLLQEHSLIQPAHHAPLCHSSCHDPRGSLGTLLLPSITSATGKGAKPSIWKKGDEERGRWHYFFFSLCHIYLHSTMPKVCQSHSMQVFWAPDLEKWMADLSASNLGWGTRFCKIGCLKDLSPPKCFTPSQPTHGMGKTSLTLLWNRRGSRKTGTTKGLELLNRDESSWCLCHWRMTMRMDGREEFAQARSPSVKAVSSPKAICRVYFENPVTAQRAWAALVSYPAEACQPWLLHPWEQQSRGIQNPSAWAAVLHLNLLFYSTSVAPLCRWGQGSNWEQTRTVCSVCCSSLLGTPSSGRK